MTQHIVLEERVTKEVILQRFPFFQDSLKDESYGVASQVIRDDHLKSINNYFEEQGAKRLTQGIDCFYLQGIAISVESRDLATYQVHFYSKGEIELLPGLQEKCPYLKETQRETI